MEMKKFLIALFGVAVLSQGVIPMGNGTPRSYNYTVACIDGYKYVITSMGYAAISVVQVYEQPPQANGIAGPLPKSEPQPATCK